MNGKYLCLEVRLYSNRAYVAAYFDEPKTDKYIIYSVDNDIDYSYTVKYGNGYSDSDKMLFKLINEHRIYYADNTAGAFLDNYLKMI